MVNYFWLQVLTLNTLSRVRNIINITNIKWFVFIVLKSTNILIIITTFLWHFKCLNILGIIFFLIILSMTFYISGIFGINCRLNTNIIIYTSKIIYFLKIFFFNLKYRRFMWNYSPTINPGILDYAVVSYSGRNWVYAIRNHTKFIRYVNNSVLIRPITL